MAGLFTSRVCHYENFGIFPNACASCLENRDSVYCRFQPFREITVFLKTIFDQLLIEWTYRNKYMQNKYLRFFPNSEDKKVKLLLTTQQSQSLFYHILMWKTNGFSRSSHRIHSKNKQTNKQSCSKNCSQFHIPQTNTYINMFAWRKKYLMVKDYMLYKILEQIKEMQNLMILRFSLIRMVNCQIVLLWKMVRY